MVNDPATTTPSVQTTPSAGRSPLLWKKKKTMGATTKSTGSTSLPLDSPSDSTLAASSPAADAPSEEGELMNRTVEILKDVKYPAAPIELYKLMFDSDFLVEFLLETEKVWDLEFEEWKEQNGLYSRDFHYTKPVSGVGPKEVYCEEREENVHRDENDYIETQTTTHTPNVTYGKSFYVVTHSKIAWAENRDEGSVLNVSIDIVWTGWCPFKGMVEGRIIDGQKEYSTHMDEAVRTKLAQAGAKASASRRSKDVKARVRFEDYPSSDEEKGRVAQAELDTGSWVEKQSPRPVQPLLVHRGRMVFMLLLVSLLLTLIVFRLSRII